MAIKKPNFSDDLEKLYSSQNEEEVTENLLRIVKIHSTNLYKDIVRKNPYFKMIVPELVDKVISQLNKLRDSISKEVNNIDNEVSLISDDMNPSIEEKLEKLKKLKTDCLLLIEEVDEKKSELLNLL